MEKNKILTGSIFVYGREVRDKVTKASEKFLIDAGLQQLNDELFSCVDELIKNSVKANYKFILIREKLYKKIASKYPELEKDEIEKKLNEIINTAPILSADLTRIFEKRKEFKRLKDLGRENEFFINNIDTSESGFGLGYAKIDSYLSQWGLVPLQLYQPITHR